MHAARAERIATQAALTPQQLVQVRAEGITRPVIVGPPVGVAVLPPVALPAQPAVVGVTLAAAVPGGNALPPMAEPVAVGEQRSQHAGPRLPAPSAPPMAPAAAAKAHPDDVLLEEGPVDEKCACVVM